MGKSESGNEVLPDRGDIRSGLPTVAGCFAFIRGVGHEAVWVFVADRQSLRTQLVAFLLLLKGRAQRSLDAHPLKGQNRPWFSDTRLCASNL